MSAKKTSLNFLNKSQHLNDQGISLFVDALKLNKAEEVPADIRSHVETCNRCKSEIMGLYDLLSDQDYSDQGIHPFFGEAPSDLAGAKKKAVAIMGSDWKFIFRIAAAVIILIAVGLYLFLSKTDSNGSARLLAENFTPSANLDNLVNETYRAYSTGVLSPGRGSNVNGTIHFRWESDYQGPFYLKILNNKEEVIREFTLRNKWLEFNEKLPPGLYYWKLESEDDLLYVGKFFTGKRE